MNENWNPDDASFSPLLDALWEQREGERRQGRYFSVRPTTSDPHVLIDSEVAEKALNHLAAHDTGFIAQLDRAEKAAYIAMRDLMLYGHATLRLDAH